MEHKAIAEFQSRNQQRNQKQYLALKLSFSPRRKSLHALSTERTPFTLSLAKRNVGINKEILNYDVYSDAHNILKKREFRTAFKT